MAVFGFSTIKLAKKYVWFVNNKNCVVECNESNCISVVDGEVFNAILLCEKIILGLGLLPSKTNIFHENSCQYTSIGILQNHMYNMLFFLIFYPVYIFVLTISMIISISYCWNFILHILQIK